MFELETMKGEGDLLKSREDLGSLPILVDVCALVRSRRKTALLLLTVVEEAGTAYLHPSLSGGATRVWIPRFYRH